jgi:AcrR family transcriptional regulator
VTTFQRARSAEQRDIRRRAILETAASMLGEMSVSELSLNELSSRVGLAKSNVMRYFESREAVLLHLLVTTAREWLAVTIERFAGAVDTSTPVSARIDMVAGELAASFAEWPMLCELISVKASVLDRNVSTEVALQYKQEVSDGLVGLGGLLEELLPELGPEQSVPAARMIILLVGALWPRTHPPQAVIDAYHADPEIAFLDQDFTAALADALEVALLGFVARRAAANRRRTASP